MNVSLTPQLEKFIQSRLKSGMYNTSSEVVREALRLLKERDEMYTKRLAELKAEAAKGLADFEQGRVSVLDFEALKAKARKKHAESRQPCVR